MNEFGVIIVAGGSGTRMGTGVPKQFLPLCGKPVLAHAVGRFVETLPGARIVVVLPAGETARWQALAAENALAGTHTVCTGGDTRFASVRNALELLPDCDIIAVHDGVRPLVSAELILAAFESATAHASAIPVTEPADSFRRITGSGSEPLPRSELRAVQTPQVFNGEILRKAYALPYSPDFTDDASVVEAAGEKVTLIGGERRNIKITTPADLVIAEALLSAER